MTQPATTDDDVKLARDLGAYYRSRGWNVLPSRPDEKRPMVRFRDYLTEPTPVDLLDRFETTNLQVILGVRWGLMAIDLDGPEACDWWGRLPHRKVRTWRTHSGGGGVHEWYRLPAGFARPMPKAILWRGEGKHSAAERLCDGSLLMVPPSIHPTTGRRYRFLSKSESPGRLAVPAVAPAWLLALPTLAPPRPAVVPMPARSSSPLPAGSGRYAARDVVDAIPDVLGLVASWGVRLGPDTGREWVPVHAIDRDDRNPSAAVNRRTGSYCDLGSGARYGLFDLAAALGVAADWREAVASLGDRYHARKQGVAS